MNTKNWWIDFFDDFYGDFILHTFNDEENLKNIQKIINKFNINENTIIFDQCCGKGSLSIPLSNYSNHIYGIDIIPSYIKYIKNHLKKGTFETKDAFHYTTPEACDIAFNWHTSFGYSDSDYINSLMIKNAYKSLKNEGIYIMQYINFLNVIQNFKPIMTIEKKVNKKIITLNRFSQIDYQRGMLCQKWNSLTDNFKWEKYGETKIYLPHQIINIFKNIGFKDVSITSDIDKNEIIDTPQLFIIGQK